MLSFGVTILATVPQGSEIPEGLMNNPVLYLYICIFINIEATETHWVNTDFLNILLFEVHPHNRWDESDGLHC